jgi:hypothetical protein
MVFLSTQHCFQQVEFAVWDDMFQHMHGPGFSNNEALMYLA